MVMVKQRGRPRRTRSLSAREEDPGLAKAIAGKLITLRRKRGFESASAAAQFLGIDEHTYLHYERGTRSVSLDRLGEILEKFDATLLELLGLPESQPGRRGGSRKGEGDELA